MKVTIKSNEVTLEDESGHTLFITTERLVEMMRVLNAATNQDGHFFFESLEFIV